MKFRRRHAGCQADVVLVAAGRAGLVTGDWIKEGAVVVDVGINAVPDLRTHVGGKTHRFPGSGTSPLTRLVGDVDYASVEPKCHLITPVPGGVGPMTIAMLLRNTAQAARRFANARADRAPGWGATKAMPTLPVPAVLAEVGGGESEAAPVAEAPRTDTGRSGGTLESVDDLEPPPGPEKAGDDER